MNVLLIDNADSFTWNLYQQIRTLGAECTVVPSTVSLRTIHSLRPDRIVISAGPGSPSGSGVSLQVLRDDAIRVPILGVCLGHQCMAHVFGGAKSVALAETVVHGKTSPVFHIRSSIFRGMASPFAAARYHSLLVTTLPKDFELLAWTGTQNTPREIMAMRHMHRPLVGVQFHPESFLTEHGDVLMKNFLSAR